MGAGKGNRPMRGALISFNHHNNPVIFHQEPQSSKVRKPSRPGSSAPCSRVHRDTRGFSLCCRRRGWELGLLVGLERVRRHLPENENPGMQQPRGATRRQALRGAGEAGGTLHVLDHGKRVRTSNGEGRVTLHVPH